MTPSHAPEQHTPPPQSHRVGGHYRGFLALLLALVLGAVIGGGIVAVYSGSDNVAVPTPSGSAPANSSTSPSTSSAGPSPSSGANVQLSAACVRSVNDAQDAYTALSGLDKAVTSLDAQKLDAIVRQVQAVQRRLKADLPACHAGIQLPSGSTSPTPSVTSTTG